MMPPTVGPGMGGQQAGGTRYQKATFAGGCFNYYKFTCGRARRLEELWGSK